MFTAIVNSFTVGFCVLVAVGGLSGDGNGEAAERDCHVYGS